MTGHQDRPDIRQRRRVTRLRAELGLAPVPPHVGTELRTVAPRVSEQVARGCFASEPAYLALSPDGQRQLLSAVARAVDEFARLVEDRPPQAPAVEAMLVEIVHVEGQLDRCRAALHAAFQTLREVARVLWPQLPQARPYSTHLDVALARYAKRLCARTMNAPRAPAPRPRRSRGTGGTATSTDCSPWWSTGGAPSRSSCTSASAPWEPQTPRRHRASAQRDTPRPLSFVTTDHVVDRSPSTPSHGRDPPARRRRPSWCASDPCR